MITELNTSDYRLDSSAGKIKEGLIELLVDHHIETIIEHGFENTPKKNCFKHVIASNKIFT